MISKNILLVGCGKMGSALFGGLLPNLESKSQAIIVSPSGKGSEFGTKLVNTAEEIPSNFKADIIILAVKPQIIEGVLTSYKKYANGRSLFISVAAGKTLGFFSKHLGDSAPVIRAMPNLPSFIGQGITTMCSNAKVTNEQKEIASLLFESVGSAIWLDDESLMDVSTGLAGSGPAYVFHFIECLINAAIDEGLSHEIATKLAIDTVIGSAMLAKSSKKSVSELKEQVISPNGTTQAGIDALTKDDSLEKLIKQTINAATKRSKELAD